MPVDERGMRLSGVITVYLGSTYLNAQFLKASRFFLSIFPSRIGLPSFRTIRSSHQRSLTRMTLIRRSSKTIAYLSFITAQPTLGCHGATRICLAAGRDVYGINPGRVDFVCSVEQVPVCFLIRPMNIVDVNLRNAQWRNS